MEKTLIAVGTDEEEKLSRVAAAIDEFEGYAAGSHAALIARLSDRLAVSFNLAAHDRLALRQAALVHDLGEQAMNREYIKSERVLTAVERIDVERHPVIGEQEAARRGYSRAVQLLIRWHHEWWNGAGYPDALSREQIPLAARILRSCDTYASLTARRSYREAFSAREAEQYLIENAAVEFDPKVVKTLLSVEKPETI